VDSSDETGSKEKSKGKEDPPIVIAKNARRNAEKRDILGWNSDGTRVPVLRIIRIPDSRAADQIPLIGATLSLSLSLS